MSRTLRAVVLNYRDPAATLRAVEDLRASRGVDVDVLVVDSASGAEDERVLRDALPADRLLLLPENLGYAGGMNAGLEFWRRRHPSEPVLLLTPDARPAQDAAAALLDALEADPALAMCGPVVSYTTRPGERVAAGGDLDVHRGWLVLIPAPRDSVPYDVEWIEGCCMLVRPDAVAAVGGFDPAYFLYYEEADLCVRLRRAGLRVAAVPTAAVLHPKAGTGYPPHYYYYMARNAYRFWGQHFGVSTRRTAVHNARATVQVFALAAGALLLPWRWREARTRLNDAWYQLAGAVAGTRDHLNGRYGARPAPRRGRGPA